MKYGQLILEKGDYLVIKRLLNFSKIYINHAHKEALDKLKLAIDNALVYAQTKIPNDVVQLYSQVTVVSMDGSETKFQMVLPNQHNVSNNKISIKSALGAAIIGLAEGDGFLVRAATGMKSMRIKKVEKK